MNKVNLGDKYNHRVTLRLTDDQYDYLIDVSHLLGVSPSDYMRMSINSAMIQFNKVGTDNENVKTSVNNIV